jgi:hypothetical protein
MRKLCFLFLLLTCLSTLNAQSFGGRWEGYLVQPGKTDTFYYQADLQQNGASLSGTSTSQTQDRANEARFELTGYWDGEQLVLQELRQISPSSPQWCIKYATLYLGDDNGIPVLSGPWKADGCSPGHLFLRRPTKTVRDTVQRALPPSMKGKWSGILSQSDRDYGFFFELNLDHAPQGTSYIVSEGNGGSARMQLNWTYDEAQPRLSFQESSILQKEDPAWPWCIKSAELRYERENSRLVLRGPWEGYIEGFDMESGACASGQLYLEKPILTESVVQLQETIEQPYQNENHRKIEVQRVIEVKSSNIKIKIWDNGTVDGDVATLYLNGERILHNYRVSKRRIGIPVSLAQNDNFLVLHAEDLGDIRPNTVAVSIDDGEREQVIIVSSNLEESGAVMIRKFKMD